MAVSVVLFLCLFVISLSKSAPVNDAPSSGSEFKRGWNVGWSSGKKKDATFGIPPGNSWEIARDPAQNDAPSRSEFKRGWTIGYNDAVNKRGVGDADKMQVWANLATNLYRLFHKQSVDKAAQDSPGKRTVVGQGFGGFFPKKPSGFPGNMNPWNDD